MEIGGSKEEEITVEQRKRAEANRLAALAKRKANQEAWKLLKCQKPSFESSPASAVFPKNKPVSVSDLLRKPESSTPPLERFRVRLEICSPDSFSVTPQPVQGFSYPGEEVCFEKLNELLLCVREQIIHVFP